MIVIGESLHVISARVRKAIDERDEKSLQELVVQEAESGADIIDLNIGPQKRSGPEVMSWLVNAVQQVVDLPLCLDTTNAAAMEAGLKLCKRKPIINSTDATPERMRALLPLAAKYKANIIALTLGAVGLPSTADARIQLAVEQIIPAAAEYGIPMEDVFFDPLVLTVNGMQDQVAEAINAIRFFKQLSDPPPMTTCGLSNVSNGAPPEVRPVLNRVFMVMAVGAGLDSAIADPFDPEIRDILKIIGTRDTSSPRAKAYVALYDAYAAGEPFDPSPFDSSDRAVRDILKTIEILENRSIYAHSYLRL